MPSPVRLGDVPAVILSEILRAVDLLVSTSSFALATAEAGLQREAHLRHLAELPFSAMAVMRKEALARSLRGLDGVADLDFDARHLRLGAYAVHLATGRVTRHGEPVTIEPSALPPLAAVPWLPYDERLLETIAHAAMAIADRQRRS